MRTLMKVHMDTAIGTEAFQTGTLQRTIREAVEHLQPEAAYFAPDEGQRTAFFVFDLEDPSQVPAIAEPFFSRLGAKVELTPVMNFNELQAGVERAEQTV